MQIKKLLTRLKHLRGRHDQLDHAWNRGMGRGGGGAALAPNQMGPLPTTDFYRQRRIELMDQQRQGTISRAEMRRQMRDLRGITVGALESSQDTELTLANQNKPSRSTKLTPSQRKKIDAITNIPNTLDDVVETRQFLNNFLNLNLTKIPLLSYVQNVQQLMQSSAIPTQFKLKRWGMGGFVNLGADTFVSSLQQFTSLMDRVDKLRGNEDISNLASMGLATVPDAITEQVLNNFFTFVGPEYDLLDQQFGISTWNLDKENTKPQEAKAKQLRAEIKKSKQKMLLLRKSITKEAGNYAILVDLGNLTAARHLAMIQASIDPSLTQTQRNEFVDLAKKLEQQLYCIEVEMTNIENQVSSVMDQINTEYANLFAMWHGGKDVPVEYLDMLKRHAGLSINPTMNPGSYQPQIRPDSSLPNPQQATNEVSATLVGLNQFLNVVMDERLLFDVNPPLIVENGTTGEVENYDFYNDTISVVPQSTAAVIAHELVHGIVRVGKNMPNFPVDPLKMLSRGVVPPTSPVTDVALRTRLIQLVAGFMKKRIQKNPGVLSILPGQDAFVPDDFSDFYIGMVIRNYSQQGNKLPANVLQYDNQIMGDNPFPEVLTMGVTLMMSDPAGFARRDPEYYRFMCVILSGAWI